MADGNIKQIKLPNNKVYDSVVMVKNYKKDTDNGSGSGFVYKKDEKYGYIITNNHVIENATSVSIVNASGEEVEGTILGKDEYLDLAVIRIPSNKVIAVAKMGTSDNLKRGEPVFAIGTPVGETYFNSVTGGYISGIDRKVTVSVETTNDWVQEVIQIDAAINPGNSGGPLFNINGEVIGVTSMKLINSSIEGMGLAIKIDDVVKHIDELEATIGKKSPDKMKSLEVYLSILSSVVEIVEVPNFLTKSETLIRDIKDRPILRAAIFANVDVIVTGDKDFLEADIEWPLIMSPAEFVSYYPTPPDNPMYVAEP